MKNIDTAFAQVRKFTLAVVCGSILATCFAVYHSFRLVSEMQARIYILANGKALEAYSSDRKENIPVEARDHVKTFHKLFLPSTPTIRRYRQISPKHYIWPTAAQKGPMMT